MEMRFPTTALRGVYERHVHEIFWRVMRRRFKIAAGKEFKERQKASTKDVQVAQNELKNYASAEEGLKPLVEGTCPIEEKKKTRRTIEL